jgi:hypothetical protein
MKKLVCSAIVAGLASMSVFGQGYMTFVSGSANGLYDIFTTPATPTKNANMQVGFIWSSTATSLAALGATISPTAANSTVASPWANLTVASLLANGWQWGTNASTSAGIFTPTASSPPPAAGDFNAGGTPAVGGTAPSMVVEMYVIAWQKALSTSPAFTGAIGWSAPFSYTLGSSTSPGGGLTASFASFGVDPVPEPSTMALAGLGGLSLLLFRRRK